MTFPKILLDVRSYLLIQEVGFSAVAINYIAGLRSRRRWIVANELSAWR
jgi:hypothetical protein